MPQPDRDTANYALHYFTEHSPTVEGLPSPPFFRYFMALCATATNEELDQLALAYPDYIAAYKLAGSADGFDLLRQLAHPDPT